MSFSQRVRHATALTRQSWAMLREQTSLLILPLVSGLCLALISATFLAPIVASEEFRTALEGRTPDTQVLDYAYLFVFYLVAFTVMNIFNGALLHCVLARIEGRPASVGAGLAAALGRLPQILAWSLVSATIGVALNVLRDKAGNLGKFVAGAAGLAWSIATYFAFPLVMADGTGPFASITGSSKLVRRTWGESALANVGVTLVFGLVVAVLVVVFAVLFVAVASTLPTAAAVAVVVLFGVALGLTVLVASTVSMVIRGALFAYARNGVVPQPFDQAALASVIHPKR
ncbi:DUF6159 family protein [Acuticoccus sp. I52.16.1]|uniref:DUF6159 family protein n=1 Tax=Acuticoccus sp. I52.16.1 TaxID=2928472 RepID=UPI001FD623BE|nr:DUF6159 family protein [Acuticoccus sp. I52.16.1]UOM35698.1 DUF6159 family protein [Acuticoccus sp. I52.16.1]